MKLVELTLTGFGPYPGTHTIDFASLEAAGVYLIGGPTGAGKSSILDAVAFALYGRVPRYAGSVSGVRSAFAAASTPTEVALRFVTGGAQYRIVRSPEYLRPKQRGTGMTTQSAKVALFRADGDEWETLSTSAAEVGSMIPALLGLTSDEFLQTIMLAQGRFAEFLHADSREREALLRQLFHSERFAKATEHLASGVREQATELQWLEQQRDAALDRAAAAVQLEPGDDAAERARDAAATAVSAADAALPAAQDALAAAEAARDASAALERDAAEHATATAELEALTAREAEISAATERIATAERAAEALPAVQRHTEAEAALASAAKAADDASAVVEERGLTGRSLPDSRDSQVRATQLAALVAALPERERQVADARATLTAGQQEREVAEAREAALPDEIAALTSRIDAGSAAAATVERAKTALADAEERVAAAQQLEALAAEEDRLAEREAQVAEAVQQAQDAVREVRQAFLAGSAATLAAELRPGAPCRVCGATEHPAPASDTAAVVTEDDVAAAETAASTAERQASDVDAARRERQAERDRLMAAAGEGDTRDALAAAKATLADAETELAQVDALRAKRTELEREAARVRSTLAEARDRDAASREALTRAEAALEPAQQELADTEFAELDADAASALVQRRTDDVAALEAHERAQERLADAREAATTASTALAAALAAHGFPDADAVRAAALPAPELRTLRELVQKHAQALARVEALLAQERLRTVPERLAEDRPPHAELEARAAEARTAYDAAVAALATARATARQVETELAAVASATESIDALGADLEVRYRLAQTLAGQPPNLRRMPLETFVLAASLEAILASANARLGAMTAGRYTLELEDALAGRNKQSGLGIRVFDDYAGTARPVASLSGGETFLASLALALGLADTVQERAGGVAMDTLFIDEGFGALDAETLELAMQTLDELRAGGRSIGVISHVQTMQERLPELIRVTPRGASGSTIEQRPL